MPRRVRSGYESTIKLRHSRYRMMVLGCSMVLTNDHTCMLSVLSVTGSLNLMDNWPSLKANGVD
jgi:hypothetical protein